MKNNILKLTAFLLILTGSVSCENDIGTYKDRPIYTLCKKLEGSYLNILKLQGNGRLFLDSIPVKLVSQNNVTLIVYYPEQDSAIFKLSNPEAIYNAEICNFPDYAKHWEIPLQGKTFSFEGDFYEEGRYLSVPPYIGGKMVLTVFKSK